MRKLGIVIALTAAATLGSIGFAGTASADGHEEALCSNITGNPIAENFGQDPSGGGGEPLASIVEGAHETCVETNMGVGLQPSGLLCGAAKGLDARPGADLGQPIGSMTVGAVNDGLAGGVPANPVVGFQACGDPTPPPPAPPSGGGSKPAAGGGSTVQGANAAADGGLPRTGGELFAGAGFALMSLGALVRRFLP